MPYHIIVFIQDEIFGKPFGSGETLLSAIIDTIGGLSVPVGRLTVFASKNTEQMVRSCASGLPFPVDVSICADRVIPASTEYPMLLQTFFSGHTGPFLVLSPDASYLDAQTVKMADEMARARGLVHLYADLLMGWDFEIYSGSAEDIHDIFQRAADVFRHARQPTYALSNTFPGKTDRLSNNAEIQKCVPARTSGLFASIEFPASAFSWNAYQTMMSISGGRLVDLQVNDVYQMLLKDRNRIVSHPTQLVVEMSTTSSIVPVYSPLHHLRGRLGRRGPFMTDETFSHVVRLLENDRPHRLEIIFPCDTGDPFADVSFISRLERLADAIPPGGRWGPVIYTYGTNFTPAVIDRFSALCRKLIGRRHKGYLELIVKLDSVSSEVDRNIRAGTPVTELLDNLSRLMDIKKKYFLENNRHLFMLAMATTLLKETEPHIRDFLKKYPGSFREMGKWREARPAAQRDVAFADETNTFFASFYKDHDPVDYGVIYGPSHFAGQIPDLRIADYTPLQRFPCRRLNSSITVLCDGTIAVCDRAILPDAANSCGAISAHDTLAGIWNTGRLKELRAAHDGGTLGSEALCSACADWYSPL